MIKRFTGVHMMYHNDDLNGIKEEINVSKKLGNFYLKALGEATSIKVANYLSRKIDEEGEYLTLCCILYKSLLDNIIFYEGEE